MPCDQDHEHAPWPTDGALELVIEACETQCGWCSYRTKHANNLRVHAHRHIANPKDGNLKRINVVKGKAGRKRVHMTPKRYHPISSTSRPIPQLSILTSPQHSQRSAICESQAPSPTIYPLHAPSLGSNYPESAKSAPVPTIELLLKPNDEMPVRFGDGRAYLINASEEQKDLACHYSGNGYISPAASPATGTDSLPESLSLTFPGKDNTERGLNELSTLFFSHLSLQGYSLLGEYKGVSAMIRRLRLQYCDGVLSPTMTKAVNSALQLHRFGYGVSNPNTDSLRESEFRAVHTILTFMGEAPQEYFHEEEILAIDELKKKHLTLCTSCQSGSHSSNTTPLGNVSIDQVMRRE